MSHRHGSHHFLWTDLHLPREKTDPLRHEYDKLGSQVVDKLQEIIRDSKAEGHVGAGKGKDLYSLLKAHQHGDETLSRFWRYVHEVPEWVDWPQIQRGQKFFYRYAAANIMGFALQGFVGENSSAAGVVEVLVRTGGFSTRVLLRRLLETFQMILQVTDNLESIQPGGKGHTTAIRVRLLHASVRNRILKLAEASPEYFDLDKFGVPVNVLDSIHSISTFCCNHMWLQLPQMGIYPTQQEMEDYIALFRYVGYILATPDEYFATVGQAKATMESMLVNELQLTPTSNIVGHNFVECVSDLPPVYISKQFIEAGSRVFNGDSICDSLGMGRPNLLYYACFKGYCWAVKVSALVQRTSPAIDKAVTAWFHDTLHEGIIHSKSGLSGGSKLDFKYVPRKGYMTGKEDSGRPPSMSLMTFRPIESACFLVFLLGVFLMLGMICFPILLITRLADPF